MNGRSRVINPSLLEVRSSSSSSFQDLSSSPPRPLSAMTPIHCDLTVLVEPLLFSLSAESYNVRAKHIDVSDRQYRIGSLEGPAGRNWETIPFFDRAYI
jgi:hypothetical protein